MGYIGHADTIEECTSQVWEGLLVLVNPSRSWVARFTRLNRYMPGSYAVKVDGTVSWLLNISYLWFIYPILPSSMKQLYNITPACYCSLVWSGLLRVKTNMALDMVQYQP